jgi:hypothetical protein
MWKDYFGPGARIVGIDIDQRCKELEEDQIEIYIGDQEDRSMLARLRERVGRMDVVVDDGGHTMTQQRITFEELYRCVPDDGVYLVEDLHTSYWPKFGGGYRQKGTFIEYAKGLVDQLNAWGSQTPDLFKVDEFTRRTRAIHFYDAVVVFERGNVLEPHAEKHGEPSLTGKRMTDHQRKNHLHQRVRSRVQRSLEWSAKTPGIAKRRDESGM